MNELNGVWLTAGQLGKVPTVTVSVVTAAGRRDERSFDVQIVER